jgi:Beta-xylosidase
VSIADIALEHGFPNAKSFYSAFKAKYNMTPNEYRSQYRPELEVDQEKPSLNYFAFNQSNALGIINQYLQRGQSFKSSDVKALEQKNVMVDITANSDPIRHTWKSLITIGKAKEGLHADVQEHLRDMQRVSPFQYLRFHGIFDDAMMVYQEDEQGEPHYNFRLIDQLFDFLKSIGLKPFVELGFMPADMAADTSKTVFFRASCVSPPKSMERWSQLVDRFLRHCINRYGLQEVESWKFEFWNEPELQVFMPDTLATYMEMYLYTYRALKSISSRLLIGAPGRIITFESKQLFNDFIAYCRENECLPDFIPLHFYPHEDIESLSGESEQLEEWFKLQSYRQLLSEFMGISPNPDYLKDKLASERRLLEEHGLADREQYLTEWNSTAYHRELTNDTMYKAAYIVKNIVDNLDSIEGFGYWVLSDNIEETAASPQLFHGGLGLIAQYGIPKAGFFAYSLLAKLGDKLIARGDGYIVTSGQKGYQILTFNYCHFDELYALGDTSFIDTMNRYNGFKEDKTIKLELDLAGLPSGKYRLITHSLNRMNGSSYDTWLAMGAPESVTTDDIQYLKRQAGPRRHVREIEIENHISCISTLEPHAVELIELIPVF